MSLPEPTRTIDPGRVEGTLSTLVDIALLSEAEGDEVRAMFEPDFPLVDLLDAADSLHLHIKVADVDAAPRHAIHATGNPAPSARRRGTSSMPSRVGAA